MKKFYLYILGCAMNYSDAERIASVLKSSGYEPGSEAEADLILIVACSVRQKAIDRIYGKVKGWQRQKRKNPELKLILSGCVLEEDKAKLKKNFDLLFDIKEISQLERFLGTQVRQRSGEYLSLVPQYESSFRAFVPIMTGCDNYCSYCAVPYTRGREVSRPRAEVVAECRELIRKGYRELTLLGQNVNSYKFGFEELLKELDAIEGDFRVYFYSNHPKDFSDELIELMSKLKHFPAYIHLPLQSGDDEILRKMNRRYNAREYLALVKKIREHLPDVTLTTDIIVGFPGEGEVEFAKTLEVVKRAKFEMIFIGQYSPRPGTVSAKMKDDVPPETKKLREKLLTEVLAENLEKANRRLLGQTLNVLIDEIKGHKYFGRTAQYKVVELKTDQPLEVGQFFDVSIKSTGPWKVFGEIA